MAKYRAVLMVPSVIEFENSGQEDVSEQARRIAASMGKAMSEHPRNKGSGAEIYLPKVMECVVVSGVHEDPKAAA